MHEKNCSDAIDLVYLLLLRPKVDCMFCSDLVCETERQSVRDWDHLIDFFFLSLL